MTPSWGEEDKRDWVTKTPVYLITTCLGSLFWVKVPRAQNRYKSFVRTAAADPFAD